MFFIFIFLGFGLFANEEIATGDFVLEYVGEVIDDAVLLSRKERYENMRRPCLYFMRVSQDLNIDAMTYGNESRFINHSCDPNCHTQKWLVSCIFLLLCPNQLLTIKFTFIYTGKRKNMCRYICHKKHPDW